MRERDVEQYLVEQVKAKGGEVRKVKWIGRNGAPDRLVLLPLGESSSDLDVIRRIAERGRTYALNTGAKDFVDLFQHLLDEVARVKIPRAPWVELKAPGEKPKPHQVREHERMRRMGQRVEVVDSCERVDEVLA